jgi:hypothetical protein
MNIQNTPKKDGKMSIKKKVASVVAAGGIAAGAGFGLQMDMSDKSQVGGNVDKSTHIETKVQNTDNSVKVDGNSTYINNSKNIKTGNIATQGDVNF